MELVLGLYAGVFALVWWQIVLVLAFFGICVVSLFNEATEVGTVFLLGAFGLLAYLNVIDVSTFTVGSVLIYTLGYIAVGCVWSLFMYKKTAQEIAVYNREQYTNRTKEETLKDIKRSISNSRISFWILYFPISITKFALSDFVDYLISKLGRVYKAIAQSAVDSVYKDFNSEKTVSPEIKVTKRN